MARATTKKPTGPNKAQAEFDKYTRRRAQAAATAAPGTLAGPSAPAGAAGPEATGGVFPNSGLTWAVPLGVGMTPAFFGGPPPGPGASGPGSAGDLAAAAGGLSQGIGTTLRLGVDLLNAALFNSAKILGGFTGTYGHGHRDDGCGCGCESCCEPSCCQPDCCGCESCSPSVGSCC